MEITPFTLRLRVSKTYQSYMESFFGLPNNGGNSSSCSENNYGTWKFIILSFALPLSSYSKKSNSIQEFKNQKYKILKPVKVLKL